MGQNRGRASKYLRATTTLNPSVTRPHCSAADRRLTRVVVVSSRSRRRRRVCVYVCVFRTNRYRRQWRPPRTYIYLVTTVNTDTTAGRADDGEQGSLTSRSSAANLGKITQGDRGSTFKFSTWNYARPRG